MCDEIIRSGGTSFSAVCSEGETHPVTRCADVGDLDRPIVERIGLVMSEWVGVGANIKGSPFRSFAEIGVIDITYFGRRSSRSEEIYFV